MKRAIFLFSRPKLGLVALVASVLAASTVRADGAPLGARFECARAGGPGRILCELTSEASSGKLVWADALVVRAPAFARPLRSRVVLQLGPPGPAATASGKLALVASELGQGELELRVRGVLCHEAASGEWCGPEIAVARAEVNVGPAAPAP